MAKPRFTYPKSGTEILNVLKACSKKRNFTSVDQCRISTVFDRLGSESSFGAAYKTCCDKDCSYILKVIALRSTATAYPLTEDDIQNEVTMQKTFHEAGLAPKIVEAFSCEDTAYIVMAQMQTDMYQLVKSLARLPRSFAISAAGMLWAKAASMVDKAHSLGLVHGDPHLQNIMINPDTNLLLGAMQDLSIRKSYTEEEALEIAREIKLDTNLSPLYTFYKFLLLQMDRDLTDDEDTLGLDLLMFLEDTERYQLITYLQTPHVMDALLNIKSALFIDFGTAGFLKDRPELVSTDWAKIGGGKYKAELLELLPEMKPILDNFSMMGYTSQK